MITVFVRHYLNTNGLNYFDNTWFPYVKNKISQQPGFLDIIYEEDKHDPRCRFITVQFKDQVTLDAWVTHDDHQAVLYDLDKFRVQDWHYISVAGPNPQPPQALENWEIVRIN